MPVTIHYDAECPFCARYVGLLRLRAAAGPVRLVDLRADAPARAALAAKGLDPDEGMVVEVDGRRFHGADALHALALLASPHGWLNRLNAGLFGLPWVGRLAYPLLRAGRNATLLALGRPALRATDAGWSSHLTLFSLLFGLFGLLHVLNYAFEYGRLVTHPSIWLVLAPATALLFRPDSRRLLVALLLVMAVDAWLQAPVSSNHTIVRNFLLLAMLLAGAWHWLRGASFERWFADVVPVGRVLLLVMYAFGIFHKINTAFLDPAVSCAVTLWRAMPAPIAWLDGPAIQALAIYGTFVVEGLIIVLLLVGPLRHWGIVLGIGFHAFLAQSGHAMYPAFSTLAIALHVLFLAPGTALRIVSHPVVQAWQRRLRSGGGVLFVAGAVALIVANAVLRDYRLVGLSWLLFAIPLGLALALLPGRPADTPSGTPFLRSPLAWLNIVGLLFLANNALPYLGLKTAQTINMFANLRLEAGVSNHLVLPWAPAPFGYLADVVTIENAAGSPYLAAAADAGRALVYYQLLDQLEREPEAIVSFVRNGATLVDQTASTLAAERAAILHPAWLRKWFHFRRVDLREPKPCSD